MNRSLFLLLLIIVVIRFPLIAQYPPAAGQAGSTAIHADSSCIVDWAIHCELTTGFVNISDTNFIAGSSNSASYGTGVDAIGKSDNMVVSLGDKGEAVLTFQHPITNGPGFDFVVFENALNDEFLELAFVEVSSNGTDFFRFPAFSLTQTDTQTGSFGTTEATKIHNLAGKYRVMYGTPFDLDDIEDNPLLNKNHITHVKVIDVCGSINPLYASFDFLGNIINDPFPTPFESSGFDLDAVGVIHNTQTSLTYNTPLTVNLYPNPSDEYICVNLPSQANFEIEIYNAQGILLKKGNIDNCFTINEIPSGLYFTRIISSENLVYRATFYKL
jgi:hypothetical protein